MKYLNLLLTAALLSCVPEKDAQSIIDKAIEIHGGKKFENVRASFKFRGKKYSIEKQGGKNVYTREFEDSTGYVRDVLFNSTKFQRYVNDTLIDVQEEWRKKYTESVNSVLYFFQLPYGLNDPAVQKEYLGEIYIFKKPYHKVKITFKQTDGGVDYQDVFIYWIHRDDNTLDYLAYSYLTDGGGTRFRQAINRRIVDGIIVQDYINFKAQSKDLPIEKHDDYFEEGKLLELSRIVNEDVSVIK